MARILPTETLPKAFVASNSFEKQLSPLTDLEDAAQPVTPKKRIRKKKLILESTISIDNPQGLASPILSPRRKSTRQAAIQVANMDLAEAPEDEDEDLDQGLKNNSRKRKSNIEDTDDAEAENNDKGPKTPRKRKRKVLEPIVYDIKPVERRTTTFKGRLGFACLNTILRALKPDPIFCSRTCRIDTIKKNGMDYVKELGLQNVRDLYKLIEWNEDNNIRFMRMSSELFPFASHQTYGYSLEYAETELKRVGELAIRLGHRLTAHPGQYTQLGSLKENVIDASVRELEYHCEIMDRMGLGKDSVMIIHMGGVFGDKAATLERFKVNYKEKLSERVKERLVLENDELCYNLDDLMPLADELNIPIVVDYHHDWINPSARSITDLIPLINSTWTRKGIRPKQHHSEPRPGAVTVMERRAHADRCATLPVGMPEDSDIDLMIEAKDKEQAVLFLYRVYGLEEVKWENLRPEKEEQGLATNGRKGRSPRKKIQNSDEGEMELNEEMGSPGEIEEMEITAQENER